MERGVNVWRREEGGGGKAICLATTTNTTKHIGNSENTVVQAISGNGGLYKGEIGC